MDSNGDEPTQAGNQYLALPSKLKFQFDDMCRLKDYQETDAPCSPFDVTPPTTPTTPNPVFESLKFQFTGPQIKSLVDMLAKMNDRGGGESESNISALFTQTANTLTDAM